MADRPMALFDARPSCDDCTRPLDGPVWEAKDVRTGSWVGRFCALCIRKVIEQGNPAVRQLP